MLRREQAGQCAADRDPVDQGPFFIINYCLFQVYTLEVMII